MRRGRRNGTSTTTAEMFVHALLLLSCCSIPKTVSWTVVNRPTKMLMSSSQWVLSSTFIHRHQPTTALLAATTPTLTAVASSGISSEELVVVHQVISRVCQDQQLACNMEEMVVSLDATPVTTTRIPGTTGRVLLLQAPSTGYSEDELYDLKCTISEEMDAMIYSNPPSLSQPVLISIQSDVPIGDTSKVADYLAAQIEREIQEYEMNVPLPRRATFSSSDVYVPSIHVEVDGAWVMDPAGRSYWDTSTLLVFDDLLNDDLRKRLLDVVVGRLDDTPVWDDAKDGPDPRRWARGCLLDIPNDEPQIDGDDGPCWGLKEEAISELCLGHHDALQEFETLLSDLFPQFTISRLSEAVLGAGVSPLTANAPIYGDRFDYHIDADPNLTPPSPWQDVYGRYPNRCSGKPRFMSCLLYLNDWQPEGWGAPTRFLDVASDTHYDVEAVSGRCVLMDQDITHSVVAPLKAAGNRPRYSIVWKLILHPKEHGQDMTDLQGGGRQWPEPLLLGSAALAAT